MHEPSPLSFTTDPPVRHVLLRDYETRGQLLLKRVGTHRYAADRSTELLCGAFAADDEPVRIWAPGDPVPPEFIEAANNPNWIIVAHGDHFESAIERHIMARRYGWPEIALNRHFCTMSIALALGLPARLSAAADALELANRKDAAGERLMQRMSKPRRLREGEDPDQTYWFSDDDRLQRLYAYCRQDVEAERALFNRLAPLSEAEHGLWQLSCRINERGFCVDRQFAEAARRIAQAAAPEIDAELSDLTGGSVVRINQVARLLAWLQQQGCTMQKLDRKAIERQLEKEDLPAAVCRVLELRLGGAQAAVKKIGALLARAGTDDRVRGASAIMARPLAVGQAKAFNRKFETIRRRQSRRCDRGGRHRGLCARTESICAAVGGSRRLQPFNDLRCARTHVDWRGLQ